MQVNQNQIGELNAQIKDVDNEYLSYKHNNKQMGTQVQKLEQTFREIRDQEKETQAQVTENMKELEVKIQV
jgi:predicted  nucleic acid-binding Zn-ribbon protein|tara:strand:+ start:1227 stop:1439 length:213 start_codon:yes stop_codon:yes gene_type:complete